MKNRITKTFLTLSLLFIVGCFAANPSFGSTSGDEPTSTNYKASTDIYYYSDSLTVQDEYKLEKCILDVYYPANEQDFATIIWFHGGGLRHRSKEIPPYLKEKGVAVVGVDYRLYPKVGAPKYIEDAAAAVAWVFNHIEQFGGSKSLIFVSGHSAGGYLTCMVGLDKRWLEPHGIDADSIAGLIPLSAQTITHFTVRAERGITSNTPLVDDLAPLYHVRRNAPPLLLITGDREMEMLGRYEENAYLMRMMKVVGHDDTRLYEMQGYGHNMREPALPLLLKEVVRITKLKAKR